MTSTPTSGPDSRPVDHVNPSAPAETTTAITGAAALTAIITSVALLWANYVESPWKHESQEWGISSDLGVAGLLWIAFFVALGVGVVYGVVVRRALAGDPARAARTAMILAIVAVPLMVAFWTGLPIVLGSAAAFLGMAARTRLGRTSTPAGVAIGLGLLVAAGALFFCVTG